MEYLVPVLMAVISVSGLGCDSQRLLNKTTDNMNFKLEVQSNGSLAIILYNNSSDTLRIWEFENSWGWSTVELKLKKKDSDDLVFLHRRKTMIWSPNMPTFFQIEPDDKLVLPLYPGDKTWESEVDLSVFTGQPIYVKAKLEILESPEAKEFAVFTGRIESEWEELQPPQKWLIPD